METIDADIAIKQKEIEVEVDSTKKQILKKQLQVLKIRKQLNNLKKQ